MARNPDIVRTADVSAMAASPWARFWGGVRNYLAARIMTAEMRAAFQTDFMGPGEPTAALGPAGTPARQWDYPPGTNLLYTPRAGLTAFDVLQNLAAFDPVRYCIEERKNRVKARQWAIVPADKGRGETARLDRAIADLTRYWNYPDGRNTFDLWISQLLEDSFLYDAATIFRWPTRDGKSTAEHVVVSGKTIKPLLDATGRMPRPPAPAFQQIIKGVPYREFTSDELVYAVRNPSVDSPYGMSEVEWLMLDINIALRRDTFDLSYYTQGNAPHGFGTVPEGWTAEQIAQWNIYFDSILAGDPAGRSKIKWVPHGFTFERWLEREEDKYVKFSEFIVRRCCAIFHVSPQAYTGQVNRATAETADESQAESADAPLMQWIEALITREIQTVQGHPDLEFRFVSERSRDELKAAQREEIEIRSGKKSLDEVRAEAGLDEIGIPPFVMTGQGPIYLRGQNPDYQRKYAPFFAMLDEQEAAGPRRELAGGEEETPPPATPGEEEAQEPEDKRAAIEAELKKWRRVALRCAREGKPQKPFRSRVIPAALQDGIRIALQAASDPGEIEKVFSIAELSKYDPNQPRDEIGRWTETGGGESPEPTKPEIGESPTRFIAEMELAEIPDHHLDGLRRIEFHENAPIPNRRTTGGAIGVYDPEARLIRLASNADNIAVYGGRTLYHEVGHHVHLSRLTDEAAREWNAISDAGRNARVSAYARTNQGEHFAEAYREYLKGGSNRAMLKRLEPRSYKFMQSLMKRGSAKMLPVGKTAKIDWSRYE